MDQLSASSDREFRGGIGQSYQSVLGDAPVWREAKEANCLIAGGTLETTILQVRAERSVLG